MGHTARFRHRLPGTARESDINDASMAKLSDEVKYLKGVGPARAEVLAKRGIISVEDLIGYLPFRYEDRSHFSQIADVVPGNVYTLRVESFGRSGDSIFAIQSIRLSSDCAG